MAGINVDLGRLSVETRDVLRIIMVGAHLVFLRGEEGDGHCGDVLKLNEGCFILTLLPVVGELLEAVRQKVHRIVLNILHRVGLQGSQPCVKRTLRWPVPAYLSKIILAVGPVD